MRTYWRSLLAVLVANLVAAAALLANDGGPEPLVWMLFLILPAAIVGLVLLGLAIHLLRLLRRAV